MDPTILQQRTRLLALIRERAYQYREEGIKLASGKISQFYFDGRMVALMPEGAHLIGELVYDAIKDEDVNAIGGLAVGAVPMVTSSVISCFRHGKKVEGIFVRNEPKKHGTEKLVEGMLGDGARVLIVDDVATTGKSLLQAFQAVEAAGAHVPLVLVLLDREEGAKEFFAERNYPFGSIFTKSEVIQANPIAAS